MQVYMPRLRDSDVVLSPELSHDRLDDRPLLLQRMNIAEQNVELQHAYERGFSLSS